jgi:hypothetical protein
MQNQARLNRLVRTAPFRSLFFWIPTVVGAGFIISGASLWMGAAAMAIAVGSVAWKWSFGRQELYQQVEQKLRREVSREHRAELQELQARFRMDRDVRSGQIVRQLRDLHRRMVDMGCFWETPENSWPDEVREQATRLYRSSFASLRQAFELWRNAQQIGTEELKHQLLHGREKVVQEVQSSIQSLGRWLDQLQAASVDAESSERELSMLRRELDQGIEAARNTEERIKELDSEVHKALEPMRGG